jgi:Flp pilus assembly pilin Flp
MVENMKQTSFWSDEAGQDLIEYTLLLAMICLASAAGFINGGGSISGIWALTSDNLSSASSMAAS